MKWKRIDGTSEHTDICDAELMMEMSTRRQNKTGLPVMIWVDDGGSYIRGGHGKRIKFQTDKSNPLTGSFGVMDLDGNVIEPKNLKGITDIVKQVRNFVHNNRYVLDKLADATMDIDDIWPFTIRGGHIASDEDIAALNAKVDDIIAKDGASSQEKS